MKLSLKYLLYIPIILFFFPAFVFWIPFLKAGYLFFFIFLYTAIIIMFVQRPGTNIKRLINVYNKTPFKYFVWILFLIIINTIFLCAMGKANITSSTRSIIMQIILFICPTIIYFICIIEKYISIKNFIRFFMFLFWLMLILGIVAYIGQLFDIKIINNIFDFFANTRLLKIKMLGRTGIGSNYSAFGLPRLDNLFEEPSFYARFLFLFLPMVYSFGLTKVKLFSNNIMDFIVKRTLIPLTWLNIVLTLSPMFLMLSLVITFIYFYKQAVFILKKYGVFMLIILLTILILLHNVDLSETYLSRILNVLNIRSFDDFIEVEPSLATRIVTYINMFLIFLHHPFCGIGFGSIQNSIVEQFYQSPVSLTDEIARKIVFSNITNTKFPYNSNFIFEFIATNGIFISILFFYFYYKLFKNIKFLHYKIVYNSSLYGVIINAIYYMLISLIIKSFYDSNFLDLDIYLILSITILIIYVIRRNFDTYK